MLRYFLRQIESTKVDVRLGVRATPDDLAAEAFDKIVVATGILPRKPEIDVQQFRSSELSQLTWIKWTSFGRDSGRSRALPG